MSININLMHNILLKMSTRDLKGLYSALLVAFDENGNINEKGLRQIVRHNIDQEADMLYPTLNKVEELLKEYQMVPVFYEVLADYMTPIRMFQALRKEGTPCFMLESVENKDQWGRYSFIGINPKSEIKISGKELEVDGVKQDYWKDNQTVFKLDSVSFLYIWGSMLTWITITVLCLIIGTLSYSKLPTEIPVQWCYEWNCYF